MLSSRHLRATLRVAANGSLIVIALMLAVSFILKAYSANESTDVRKTAALGISDRRDVAIWRDAGLSSNDRCSDMMDALADSFISKNTNDLEGEPLKRRMEMTEQLCWNEWREFGELHKPVFTDVVAQSRIDRAFRDCKLALHVQAKLAGTLAASSVAAEDDDNSLRSAANRFRQASEQASACRSAMLTL
ncbi:hypothetical protein GRI42_06640 [Erythrobacter gaetbuli]|uniref:Uncharacterized protein n=1 Tax=Qipengyuania gaetbuli TaxID=266952 RepID=A0A844Y1H6_9SPHN|nr:hypothetical protein [Qipengyuania gaetbuli]MXO50978.1 hypothetical protein [Qipengyuania gaetbuli]